MKFIQLIIITAAVITGQFLEADTLPLKDLKNYADGLNIEGGIIPRFAMEADQLWANVCFVLDRPLLNQLDLDEITRENPYRLKEASIPSYNEPQAAWVQAVILKYYIENVHCLCGIPGDEFARLIVQVHRNSSGPAHIDLLEEIINELFADKNPKQLSLHKFRLENCILELRHGYASNDMTDYEGANVVISISLVAGLKEQWDAGTPLFPETFVPFDLHSMIVVNSAAFASDNHLISVLPELIACQNLADLRKINTLVNSQNPSKKHLKAYALGAEDIKKCTIFQANGMFYPKQLHSSFEVY